MNPWTKKMLTRWAIIITYLAIGLVRSYYFTIEHDSPSDSDADMTVVGLAYVFFALIWPLIVLLDDVFGGIGELVQP